MDWICANCNVPNEDYNVECSACGQLPEWYYEVCEHGLSAWLCAGPNHYSDDF